MSCKTYLLERQSLSVLIENVFFSLTRSFSEQNLSLAIQATVEKCLYADVRKVFIPSSLVPIGHTPPYLRTSFMDNP